MFFQTSFPAIIGVAQKSVLIFGKKKTLGSVEIHSLTDGKMKFEVRKNSLLKSGSSVVAYSAFSCPKINEDGKYVHVANTKKKVVVVPGDILHVVVTRLHPTRGKIIEEPRIIFS